MSNWPDWDNWEKSRPPRRWKIWWEIVSVEKEKGISNPDQGYPEEPQQANINEEFIARFYDDSSNI